MESVPRVLLVDPDPLALRALEEIFRGAGMATLAAPDLRGAMNEAVRSPPDLCVVEVALQDASAFAWLVELRRRPELSRTAAIGISAHSAPQLLTSGFDAGVDDFIFKPVAGEELLLRSRLAIERRRSGTVRSGQGTQRRDLTALFCDVRGFTAIAGQMDPEWVVEVLNGLFDRLVAQIQAWGGQVDKFLGDGLLALFGTWDNPRPKELCAIQAALSMVQATEEFSRESLVLGGRKLAVGVGIASGQAVIAPVGSSDFRQVTAIGDCVNLASRLQGIAAEGEVLICAETFRRVEGTVITGAAREVRLKGVSGVPLVHPVVGLRPDGWLG